MRLEREDFHSVLEYEGYLEAGKCSPHATSSAPDYKHGWRMREVEMKHLFSFIEVTAGKGDKSPSYRKTFNSISHAVEAFMFVSDYPWAMLEFVTEYRNKPDRRVLIMEAQNVW